MIAAWDAAAREDRVTARLPVIAKNRDARQIVASGGRQVIDLRAWHAR